MAIIKSYSLTLKYKDVLNIENAGAHLLVQIPKNSSLTDISRIMKRLFFALWPDDETRNQIDHFSQSINVTGLKKVTRNNLHVTLIFLGQVDDESEAIFRQGAEKIKTEPFRLTFDQLVFWKKPGILCLTAQQHDLHLLALVDALKNLADQRGFKAEERPYQAHITLARKATHAVKIKFNPVKWQAHSFCLVESCSTPEGVIYQVLHRWCLRSKGISNK